MKIIMNNVDTEFQAAMCMFSVKQAVADKIKAGRHNFKYYTFGGRMHISVYKNKHSYVCHYKEIVE